MKSKKVLFVMSLFLISNVLTVSASESDIFSSGTFVYKNDSNNQIVLQSDDLSKIKSSADYNQKTINKYISKYDVLFNSLTTFQNYQNILQKQKKEIVKSIYNTKLCKNTDNINSWNDISNAILTIKKPNSLNIATTSELSEGVNGYIPGTGWITGTGENNKNQYSSGYSQGYADGKNDTTINLSNFSNITINPNGGYFSDGTTDNKIFTSDNDYIGFTMSVRKDGYVIEKWGIDYTDDMDGIIFSPIWKTTPYTISYGLDGGTTSNPETYNIETDTFTLTSPTKTDYMFTGWSGTDIDGLSTDVVITKGSTGDRIYTANWIQSIASFQYIGKTQQYTIPISGIYKLEVWGAKGGDNECAAGHGAYVTGTKYLEKGTILYIACGGSGWVGCGNAGGWNGGGYAGRYGASGSGGGATHIATKDGTLQSLVNDKSSVLIVAGAGGGGGAISGGIPSGYGNNGMFGRGSDKGTGDGGGGGSGWYGGACRDGDSGAYGGSDYIGGVDNGKIIDGANNGAGRALITYIN